MALYGGFAANKNFSELLRGDTYKGTRRTAATRQAAARVNLGIDSAITVAGAKTFSGALLASSTLGVTGVITPTGGLAAAGGFTVGPRCFHTGDAPALATTSGTNLDIVVTELYLAEVFIPANCSITGIAVFNGTAVLGNLKVMLFNSAGTRLAISVTTAASGTTAFQRIAFASPLAVLGPATYYVGVMGDNAGGDLRTHVLGNFGASKVTGLVYATEAGYATVTPPTTFTTGVGPLASLY